MVSVPCMAHDMPIPMVIIALYPKHIQVGEFREMFLLSKMSYKVLSAKYMIYFIWLYMLLR